MTNSDDQSFECLVERYRGPLTRTAYHLCGDQEMAHDVVQDTLVDAYKGYAALRAGDKAGSWLYAILRRKAALHRRRGQHDAQLTTEPTAPGPEDAATTICNIVVEQMAKIPREDREILGGKYLLGLSYRELAESLGISESAVRVRSFRAKERLRKALTQTGLPAGVIDHGGDRSGV